MNEYRRRLEAEYQALVRRRIGLRGLLEAVSKGWQSGGSEHTLDMAKQAQQELRASEFRYGELKHLLGMPEPTGPIDLKPYSGQRPAQSSAVRRGSVSLAPARRTAPGYMTKIMTPGR